MAVALVAAATSAQVVAQVQWVQRFLEDEDLPAEEDATRKAFYFVTLPHPGQAAQGMQGLRISESLTRAQVVQMILDAVACPAYQDSAAQGRHGPSIRIEQMVVFRELYAPSSPQVQIFKYTSDGGHPSAKLITVILRFCLSSPLTPGSMLPAIDKIFVLSGTALFAQH